MCGIAGIAGYKGDPTEYIEAMKERLIRRGPDSEGNFIDADRHVVIGHRRLSIIDLSVTGAQPMISDYGRYVMAFNGEIYNAERLRAQLKVYNEEMNFKGTSDTEVLLKAIETWGLRTALEKSRGMWGISLYDRETGIISLTRDRAGEKPLYYGTVNGQFVWASDLAAIAALPGFKKDIDRSIIPVYLRYGYIPAPYTIYKGIYKLTPGTILTIAPPYNTWKSENYYDIRKVALYGQSHRFEGSEDEAADRLEMLLKDALRGQMLSDVPLGAFLSGGIDSTLTVSLMQQLSKTPVKTFTIGFEEEEYNEAAYAAETSIHLGTQHTQMYVGYKDVMDLLPKLSECFAEPFADSSALPTMLVSKMTRQHVTVALSGDAGDEFFCGYNTYKDAKKGLKVMRSKLGSLKGGLRKGMGIAVSGIDSLSGAFASNMHSNIHKLNQVLSTETIEDYYRAMSDRTDVRRLINGVSTSAIPKVADDIYETGFLDDPVSNLMLMDMLQYLPDDILTKVDRSGMYYSLETRIPLLDADVMEFAWTLPPEYKMRDGITKRPLRNVLYRYVPREMMNRPKKGFSVPVSKWLREGDMRNWAESVMADGRNAASDYIDMKEFDRIWKAYTDNGTWSGVIWYVLVLMQWLA